MTDLSQRVTHLPAVPLVTEGKPDRRSRGRGRRPAAGPAPASVEDPVAQSRLMDAASQLHDGRADAEARMAGMRALVELADENLTHRQQCIDLLCATVRATPVPFPAGQPEPDDNALRAYRDDRGLRHAVVNAITSRLRPDARISWRGCDLDFTGAIFDGDHSAALTAHPGGQDAPPASNQDPPPAIEQDAPASDHEDERPPAATSRPPEPPVMRTPGLAHLRATRMAPPPGRPAPQEAQPVSRRTARSQRRPTAGRRRRRALPNTCTPGAA